MTPDFRLNGKLALVTGASRGIGAAVAHALAAQGARVIVSSRKPADCGIVAAAIRDQGGQAEVLGCHIGEMAQIEAAFDAIRARHGRLDVLVNNAAANPWYGPATETDLAAFQKTVDVNVRGYFFMTARGAQLMAANGGGSIVNVASVNGVRPGPLQGIYSITKAAVIAMTRVFAQECAAQGVRVNALLPGLTDTKFAAPLVRNETVRDAVLASVPLNRVAQPEEMAGAVVYLASAASSYVTGSCLTVDGGLLLH